MKHSFLGDRVKSFFQYVNGDPLFILRFIAYLFFIVVFFPKFLWYRIRSFRVVAIDWHWKHYGSFFYSIYREFSYRLPSDVKTVFFFRFDLAGDRRFPVLRKGLPAFYRDFLERKVVLSVDSSRYKKLSRTIRIQMFHGFASFGSVWSVERFIEPYDVFFLSTFFQEEQLQTTYRCEVKSKAYHLIGYPKLDDLMSTIADTPRSGQDVTIFYGPTWHRDISSIFDFLPAIAELCSNRHYRLLIKLHPYLYHRHNAVYSGGVDWIREIRLYQQKYPAITLVKQSISLREQGRLFAETDLFLTDVSGIGFEYVLTTGRPIVFLGDRLKIPVNDLLTGKVASYQQYPEIYYRQIIGPVASSPPQLEQAVDAALSGEYRKAIDDFQHSFVPNLGTSSQKAVAQIVKYLDEI